MKLSVTLWVSLTMFCPVCFGAQEKALDIYALGLTRMYAVHVPRHGFIGAPWPDEFRNTRRANAAEDFRISYLLMSIVDHRKIENGQRIVIRIDEIKRNGDPVFEGLYYAYVDILPTYASIFYRYDDEGDWPESGIRNMIPFPCLCARPPVLCSKSAIIMGHVSNDATGVVYEKSESTGDNGVSIEVVKFQHAPVEMTRGYSIKQIDATVAHILLDAEQTEIVYREVQKWEKPDDWLWVEMERFDEEGNVLMRCKEVQLAEEKTADSQPANP